MNFLRFKEGGGGLAGDNGQMISNYFSHALGTGTIKKDMTKQEIRETMCTERWLVFLSSKE